MQLWSLLFYNKIKKSGKVLDKQKVKIMFRINAAFFDVIDRYQFFKRQPQQLENKTTTFDYYLDETPIDEIRYLLNHNQNCHFSGNCLVVTRLLSDEEKEKELEWINNGKKSCVAKLQKWINNKPEYMTQIKEYLEYKQIIIEGLVFPV